MSISYSSEEHAAFNLADQLEEDSFPIDRAELRKLLNALACESHRARTQLDRAMWSLKEKSKAKRENVFEIIRMERA